MKSIYETFTDEEMKVLTKNKNGLSWHDFLLLLAKHCDEAIRKGDLKIYKMPEKTESSTGNGGVKKRLI